MSNLSEKEKVTSLLELLDRLLDKGIVLYGDLTISIADVDLIYAGLRLVIGGIDTIYRNWDEALLWIIDTMYIVYLILLMVKMNVKYQDLKMPVSFA